MITNNSQMTGAIGESLAAAAGYKPAPQLGYLIILHTSSSVWQKGPVCSSLRVDMAEAN